MPAQVDELKVMRYKESRLRGASKTQALIDIGLKPETADAHTGDNGVGRRGEALALAEVKEKYGSEKIIADLTDILRLKISVEKKLFSYIDGHKKISPKNLKEITLAINKTKDNIAEIGKLLRLYEGEPTDIFATSDGEKSAKVNRLMEMARELPAGALTAPGGN